MNISYKKNNSRIIINQSVVPLLLFLLAVCPFVTRAHDINDVQSKTRKLSIQKSDKFNSVIRQKRFQIEVYAGFAPLNPSDLNLFVDYDNKIQDFTYESYLNYLQTNGQIRSWTKSQEGDRGKIKSAFPVGMRLKFYFNQMIAVSVGFRYLLSDHISDLDFQYTRNELSDEQYIENLTYSPYSLSTKAYIPMLGIHISKKIKNALVLESFLCGGPMFVECHYQSDWSYEWRIKGNNYNWLAFSSAGVLEEKGKGTGIAFDLGGKLSYPLDKNLEVFVEGGYAYQVAKSITGEGKEISGASSNTWDGEWGVKKEKITAPWGELEVKLPANYWPDNSSEGKVRDFELDLSGFQLRLGLSLRF